MRPVDRLWHLIAQRTLLADRYTGNIEQVSLADARVTRDSDAT